MSGGYNNYANDLYGGQKINNSGNPFNYDINFDNITAPVKKKKETPVKKSVKEIKSPKVAEVKSPKYDEKSESIDSSDDGPVFKLLNINDLPKDDKE
jgi:hypothetical protein